MNRLSTTVAEAIDLHQLYRPITKWTAEIGFAAPCHAMREEGGSPGNSLGGTVLRNMKQHAESAQQPHAFCSRNCLADPRTAVSFPIRKTIAASGLRKLAFMSTTWLVRGRVRQKLLHKRHR